MLYREDLADKEKINRKLLIILRRGVGESVICLGLCSSSLTSWSQKNRDFNLWKNVSILNVIARVGFKAYRDVR